MSCESNKLDDDSVDVHSLQGASRKLRRVDGARGRASAGPAASGAMGRVKPAPAAAEAPSRKGSARAAACRPLQMSLEPSAVDVPVEIVAGVWILGCPTEQSERGYL